MNVPARGGGGVVAWLRSGWRQMARQPMRVQAALLGAAQVAGIVVGFSTSVVAARFLGPTDFGVAAIVVAFPSLVWSVVSVKTNAVTVRYIAGMRGRGDLVGAAAITQFGFAIDFALSLVTVAIVSLAASWATREANAPGTARLALCYALSLPCYSLAGTGSAVLSCWRRFDLLALLGLAERVAVLALTAAVVTAGYGIAGFVLARAAVQLVAGVATAVAATVTLRRDGVAWLGAPLAPLAGLRREFANLLGWNYLTVTVSGIVAQLPVMILGQARGPAEVGYLRLATNLVGAGASVEGALGRVAYPTLSERWARGEHRAVQATLRAWTLVGGLPLAAGMLVAVPLLPPVLKRLVGTEYDPMIPGLQAMVLAAAVSVAFFYLVSFYYAAGRVALWAKASVLWGFGQVAIVWLVADRFGFMAVAATIAAAEVTFTFAMALRARGVFRDAASEQAG